MILERFINGRARTNAYLWAPEPGGDCVVVDPGVGAAAKIARRIEEHALRPAAILLTHGHPDHTWTVRGLSERFGVPAYMHRDDWRWLSEPATGGYIPIVRLGGRIVGMLRPLRPARLEPADPDRTIELAGAGLSVLHTPGHTDGSVCFVAGDVCFVGDTMFRGSVGHTLYPGGDRRTLLRSLRDQVLDLPDTARILPGHGEETLMGAERRGIERLVAT